MNKRKFGFCAKGGHEKVLDTTYVCNIHRGMKLGGHTHCAGCGTEFDEPGRRFLCPNCLTARGATGRLEAARTKKEAS